MEKYSIITYDISKLEQKKKMQLIRKLNGYDSIKKGAIERKQGLLQEINGFKFGINTIIIPIKNQEKINQFFKQFKTTTKTLTIKL